MFKRRQRLDFLQLERHEVEPGVAVAFCFLQGQQTLLQGFPADERGGGALTLLECIADVIEQVTLHGPPAERLVKMLPMDVDKHLPEHFQLLQRGTALPLTNARDRPSALIARRSRHSSSTSGIVDEPGARIFMGGYVEFRTELRPFRAGPYQLAAPAVAKHQAKCVDKYRLAGPRFAGQYGHAIRELDIDCIDDRKVANLQAD